MTTQSQEALLRQIDVVRKVLGRLAVETRGMKDLKLRFLRLVKLHALANLSGRLVQTRTGQLRRTVNHTGFETQGNALCWGLQEGSEQVGIAVTLEEGKTILPKNGKSLRIPLKAAMTAKGVDRLLGIKLREHDIWKEYRLLTFSGPHQNVIWRKSGSGDVFSGGAFAPWYLLVRSVSIRGRFWLKRAVDESFGSLDEFSRNELEKAIRGEMS